MPYDISARVPPVVELIRQAALRGERCPTNVEIGAAMRMRPGHVSSVITMACEQGLIAAESRRRRRVLRAPNGSWCTSQAEPHQEHNHNMGQLNWNAAAIDKLRKLWAEGHSTAEIARRMGGTKNAIVGKAHRIGLPGRPSPIRIEPAPKRPERAPRQTLPPLRSVQPGALTAGTAEATRRAELGAQTRRENTDRRISGRSDAMLPAALPLKIGAVVHRTCQFPMWPHNARPGRNPLFCGSAEVVPGRAYCADHCRKAFTTRREEEQEQRAA